MNEQLENKIKEVLPKLEGWCSEAKAEKLADYITEKYFKLNGYYPSSVVELGVFGGKSLIPMAMALKHNWETHNVRGIIDGIDMWSKDAAYEGDIGQKNVKYWEEVPFDYVLKRMQEVIQEKDLAPYVQLHKGKTYEMDNLFKDQSIDILHQDSSHSTETSMQEVLLYFPKMKEGSIWIQDDYTWQDDSGNFTLKPAYDKLLELGFKELEEGEQTDLQANYKVLRKV